MADNETPVEATETPVEATETPVEAIETPVVAIEAPVDVKAEVEEPQQEFKLEEALNETQEQVVKQEETIDVKQDESVGVEQDESVAVKQEISAEYDSVGVKQEEPASVKQDDSADMKQDESIDVEQDESVAVKQEISAEDDSVGMKQEEPASVKQDDSADVEQAHGIKQEEAATDVKQEAEVKDEAAVDVVMEDPKAATDKKTTGGPRRVYENKSKFDPTVLPDSDNPEEIRKQVEFYFSESNISSDRFLFSLVGGKENKPVPLNLIASFKRMKRFPNRETIIDALKESALVELGGDPGEETVKRKSPIESAEFIPEDRRYGVRGSPIWPKSIVDFEPNQDPTIHRSIYAKGFSEETATTQMDIERFFEPYGPINAVRLRRDMSRQFKRSVFVEFSTNELAQNFMALEKKPVWEDKELMWLSKLAYVQGKVQDIKDGKVQAKHRPDIRTQRGNNHNGGHKHNGNRGNDRNGRSGNDRNGRGGGNDRNGRGGSRGRGSRGKTGRGGRGGYSNDRRGGDRDNNKRGGRGAFKKEDNGIPKIKSSGDAIKSESTDASTQNGAGKRKATDEGAQEVKKPKVEVTTA